MDEPQASVERVWGEGSHLFRPAVAEAVRLAQAKPDPANANWSLASWLGGCVVVPVAAALLRPLADEEPSPQLAHCFVRALGLADRAAVRELLSEERTLDGLANAIHAAARQLALAPSPASAETTIHIERTEQGRHAPAAAEDDCQTVAEGRSTSDAPNLSGADAARGAEAGDRSQQGSRAVDVDLVDGICIIASNQTRAPIYFQQLFGARRRRSRGPDRIKE